MRLRKQLLLASLFTLSLPWVGCQYIQEMESALLQGQNNALNATARAISATIENDTELLAELVKLNAPLGATSVHAFPFQSPLTLDGYNEEWHSYAYSPQQFISESEQNPLEPLQLWAGEYSDKVWLFFSVPDNDIRYYNPTLTHGESDHIVLHADGGKIFTIVANSPGQGQVVNIQNGELKTDHQIKAMWRESQNGYQVEISLPNQYTAQGLQFQVMNGQDQQAETRFSNVGKHYRSNNTLPPVTRESKTLHNALGIFNRDGISLKLATNSAALVANTGKLHVTKSNKHEPKILPFIYRIVLQNDDHPPLPQPEHTGHFRSADVMNALLGLESHEQYNDRSHTVSSVSVPIRAQNTIAGVLVAQQSANSLSTFTNTAFSRLLLYSMLVSLSSALILVLYASWLSFRISRLSRSASSAISETGQVNDQFQASRLHDELGDLSRSFGVLHARLKEYTHYLKTLSSKLSHELRTPLAIVSSSLDNLEHEALSKQAKVYALRAKEGSARLSTILNSMSAASRVEQAIGSAEIELIPVNELLENLKAAYSDVYPHVVFTTAIHASKAGYSIMGAGELLVQMLDKLVDNAADFCPQGGQIEFGLYTHQDDIVITVRNEGPTLPQKMHQQLFDSMVSVRDHRHDSSKHHLGLGLHIVRLIVDFHQGSVQCYNVPDNSGVVFEIRLPKPV